MNEAEFGSLTDSGRRGATITVPPPYQDSRDIGVGDPIRFDFTSGEVIKVETIFGEYVVIQYHPVGHLDRSQNSWRRDEAIVYRDEIEFQVYRIDADQPDGIYRAFGAFDTLDSALANAIAVKHDGFNTRADSYFMRSIGAADWQIAHRR